MSCGVGHRLGLDLLLLWLWRRLAAVALIQPLAWELHMPRVPPEKEKKKKKKKKKAHNITYVVFLSKMCLILS